MPFEMTEEKQETSTATAPIETTEAPPEATETTEAPKPPEPTVADLQAKVKELERQRDRSAAAARRKAEGERDTALAELDAAKKKLAAGAEPLPPDPELVTTDPAKYRSDLAEYNRKSYAWQRAQEAPVSAPPKPTDDLESPPAGFEGFLERSEPLRKQHADFDEVVNRPVFSNTLRDAIYEDPNGPELAYFLGKNPTEAFRIGGLPQAQLMREIGKLEAKLSATTPRVNTQAPAPITPVQGTAPHTKDISKMTTEEYAVHRRAQMAEEAKTRPFG